MKVQLGWVLLLLVIASLPSISNADALNYTYKYDDLNRLTQMLDTCGNQIDYSYDDAGNLTNRQQVAGTACDDVVLPVEQAEINLISSCLAGNGRIDLNIVNTQTSSSVYRLEFGSLSPRQVTVAFNDWGRLPITGRLPNTYPAVVKRDGVEILNTTVTIDCSAALPSISVPEVTIINACRGTTANKGQVFFQMVNPTATSRPYIIEFENVANRSTTAAVFGQTRRGTTGRPDGTYTYKVRTGSTDIDNGEVTVACN